MLYLRINEIDDNVELLLCRTTVSCYIFFISKNINKVNLSDKSILNLHFTLLSDISCRILSLS